MMPFKDKAKRKEYHKNYRIKNKERILEKRKIWKEKNPTYKKDFYLANKDRILEYHKNYRMDNPELMLERDREYRKNNKEKLIKIKKKYRKSEKGKILSQRTHFKRKTKMKDIINTLTAEEWLDILKEHKYKCIYCDKEFDLFELPTKDHIIPISKGGNNIKRNIVPACRSCNSKKHNKILQDMEIKNYANTYKNKNLPDLCPLERISS